MYQQHTVSSSIPLSTFLGGTQITNQYILVIKKNPEIIQKYTAVEDSSLHHYASSLPHLSLEVPTITIWYPFISFFRHLLSISAHPPSKYPILGDQ